MATTRRREEARIPLDAPTKHVLQFGELPGEPGEDDGTSDRLEVFLLLTGGERLRQAWVEHGDEVVREWIAAHPGSRPWAWWAVVAPEKCRRRLRGIGVPAHECLAYAPSFSFGLPTSWVSRFDQKYYSGKAVDANGQRIGLQFDGATFQGVPIAPNDPPRYESEASYLLRLRLLTPGERARLRPEDFLPETIAANDDHDGDDDAD